MKSPVIKLACSDLQHTRIGDHPVEDEVARCKPGDQVIRDRRSKHIARDEGDADYEGGRRDHREGVRRHPKLANSSRDRTPKLAMHWATPCISNLA